MTDLIHIASISTPHGLAGQFKLHCLLESPQSLAHFKHFYDEHGGELSLKLVSLKGKQPIAATDGVTDRNAAEGLKQTKIYAKSTDFPAQEEGEYYPHELADLQVRDAKNKPIGTVLALLNFGAGDILEITFNNGKTELFPFDEATFPELNMEERYVTFVPPLWVE